MLGLGGGLDYFLTTVFNYPTLAECYKVAAHNAANKLALVRRAQDARASVLQFGGKRFGTRLRGRSAPPKSS